MKNRMNKCIYLLHGFASAPKYPSNKSDVLERVFELPVKQLRYDSSASFHQNFEKLKKQVDIDPLFFVGTSLGGFYASKLAEYFYAQKTSMPIMLNPCHNPAEVLKVGIGSHINFVTNTIFELTDATIASYRDIPFIDSSLEVPRWILLNMDDELINANETKRLFDDKLAIFSFKSGGHRFENIDSEEVIEALENINNSCFSIGVTND